MTKIPMLPERDSERQEKIRNYFGVWAESGLCPNPKVIRSNRLWNRLSLW